MYTKRAIFVLIQLFAMDIAMHAQAPAVEWQKCFGGGQSDNAQSIEHTNDGGYIIAGSAASTDGDLSGSHGLEDFWVIKTNASGTIQWQKSIGGGLVDRASVVHQTLDGGYIVAGSTYSHDGQVTANHDGMDYWVVKLDAAGNILWQKTYGGSANDFLYALQITNDGGYIAAGSTGSSDGDLNGNNGARDYWIVKLNPSGTIQWQKNYGGSSDDEAYTVQPTTDGGYIVAGYTLSNDGDVTSNHGQKDYWIIKLTNSGNLQWQKCFGSSADDQVSALQQTADGGFVASGYSGGADGDVTANHGNNDYWIVKLNAGGNLQWQKSFGGSSNDQAYAIQSTPDGGFIAAGFAQSDDGDVTCHVQGEDYWVVKMSSTGNLDWQKDIGGNATDAAYSIESSPDGGFLLAGFTSSPEINGYHPDEGSVTGDYWIIKLSGTILVPTNPVISINTPTVDICTGSEVTFTATANLEGNNPSWIWEKNGIRVGANNSSYTANDIADGDVFVCKLNTTDFCTTYSSESNSLTMYVSNTMPPSIAIASDAVSVCSGSNITFSAIVTNGHGNPFFQWKLNGVNVGKNSSTYRNNAAQDGDLVSCTFTDISPCSLVGINSNVIKVQIATHSDPAVAIVASANNICSGTVVTFTATPSVGSGSPTYQWQVNGVDVGTGDPSYTSVGLNDGDVIHCTMINDPALGCVANPTTTSNDIVMKVTNASVPTAEIAASDNNVCAGTNIHFVASAKDAGSSPSYQWKINNINTGNNSSDFTSNTLSNGDKLTCIILPASNACSDLPVTSNSIVMNIKNIPIINIFPADTVIKRGDVIELNASITNDVASYQWDPPNKLSNPMSLTPTTVPISEKTTFTLRATGMDGCTANKVATIKISGPLYMPNAFSPNGDGKNDVFRIPSNVDILLREFSVFDRWGNKIFSTHDVSRGWDGTEHGTWANTGVYVYIVSGSNEKGDFVDKGSFVLIR